MPDHAISDVASHSKLNKLINNGTNNNYGEWAMKLYHQLLSWGIWKYINGPELVAPIIPSLEEPSELTGPDKELSWR